MTPTPDNVSSAGAGPERNARPASGNAIDQAQGGPTLQATHHRGTGWVVTSGILLLLAGGSILINGLWALHANNAIQQTVRGTLLFSESNLDTWGWIYTITGAVLIVVGIAVFFRAMWAVILGMIAAGAGILLACLWLFTPYWPDALISILLNGIVLFSLGTYGLQPDSMAA